MVLRSRRSSSFFFKIGNSESNLTFLAGVHGTNRLTHFLFKVHHRFGIPFWPVIVACVVPALLALINLGSTVVFNDVVSLGLSGFYSTYLISITLLLYRRLTGAFVKVTSESPLQHSVPTDWQIDGVGVGLEKQKLAWGPWHVPGILGVANNIFACCFLLTVFIFSFFPPAAAPTASTMTFTSLIFGAVVLFSMAYYLWRGRRQFRGPVVDLGS